MSYCSAGQSPVVNYKFANGGLVAYQCSNSPIDVEITHIPTTFSGGQCPILYNIRISDSGGPSFGFLDLRFWGPIIAARIIVFSKYSYSFNAVLSTFNAQVLAGGTNYDGPQPLPYWITIGGGQGGSYSARPLSIVSAVPEYQATDPCGNLPDKDRIEVKYDGVTVFQDTGNAPCTFTVQCEDCPPGTVKCNSSSYPGYCCIPCQSTAQRINNLASRL